MRRCRKRRRIAGSVLRFLSLNPFTRSSSRVLRPSEREPRSQAGCSLLPARLSFGGHHRASTLDTSYVSYSPSNSPPVPFYWCPRLALT
ncbi:hypothetical protein C8R43DRAFT_612343 [Mycena crocata]|nr:hypothetical protein C8R43DRAFT_612343 [Mycena crocata]